ncbi:MAG: 50S ribosomal protein L6 [Rhodospirillaceae bacterium]|jgi:large subunit ribosomal protein L6|nr:50S ribosomal protein L6 [Rhodospirillaceae bacterium]
MSRVGKYPVAVPAGVTVSMAGKTLLVKGKLGELKLDITDDVETKVEDGKVSVSVKNETKRARAQWGTTRATINNMVKGVSQGYKKTLDITGVGFKAAAQGKKLTLNLGFSHDVIYTVPEGIEVKTPVATQIEVSGANRQRVGQVAAEIRGYKRPEPYKGKGIRYSDETILRKEGKKK